MQKGKRDTSGLQVVSRHKGDRSVVTTYLFSVTGSETVERTNYLMERVYTANVPEYKDHWSGRVYEPAHKKGDTEYSRRTETRQKVLCVGGPLAGQRVTKAAGYSAYNAANFNRGRNRQTECRVIFVHDALLKG